MTIETLIWLFPIMFMIHELEEIIFMKPWIKKNAATIQKRFPFIGRRFRKATKDFSTRKFALIVAEEFIIISAVTVVSMQWGFINMFTGMLIAYSLHLFIHIVQFIIYRRYIPTIVTSLISIIRLHGLSGIACGFGSLELNLCGNLCSGIGGQSFCLPLHSSTDKDLATYK